MERTKLIIFDVGGVIDNFDEKLYTTYISKKLGLNQKKFRGTLLPMLDKMEVGKMNVSAMEKILAKTFKTTEIRLEWNQAFLKLNSVNEDMVRLINRLSKNYKIAILTNVSRSRHMLQMRYMRRVKYDGMFASCYLGLHKPEHRIYRFVLKRMATKPQETIFVDNLWRNVEGARGVGIRAIQFVGYADLRRRFKAMGIKVN